MKRKIWITFSRDEKKFSVPERHRRIPWTPLRNAEKEALGLGPHSTILNGFIVRLDGPSRLAFPPYFNKWMKTASENIRTGPKVREKKRNSVQLGTTRASPISSVPNGNSVLGRLEKTFSSRLHWFSRFFFYFYYHFPPRSFLSDHGALLNI